MTAEVDERAINLQTIRSFIGIPNTQVTLPMSRSKSGQFLWMAPASGDLYQTEAELRELLAREILEIARDQCVEAHGEDLLPPDDDGWELRSVGDRPLYTGGVEHPEYPIYMYELHHPRECDCVARGPHDPNCQTCGGRRWT